MTAAVPILAGISAGLLSVLVACAVLLWWRSAHGLMVERTRRRVIVTLKSGDAFGGVLWAADGQVLILREAQAVPADAPGQPVTVDGEAMVYRSDVAYVQIP